MPHLWTASPTAVRTARPKEKAFRYRCLWEVVWRNLEVWELRKDKLSGSKSIDIPKFADKWRCFVVTQLTGKARIEKELKIIYVW